MRFDIVRPATQVIQPVHEDDIEKVYTRADLRSMAVDHGVVVPGIGIVVHEYGLFVDPKKQQYFTMNHLLYAGNAVLYGFDEGGNSISLDECLYNYPPITFLLTVEEVEAAILNGVVRRPQMSVNGEVFWQWPDTKPVGL